MVPDTSRLEFLSAELLRKLAWPGQTTDDEGGGERGHPGKDGGGNDGGCGYANGSDNIRLMLGEGGPVVWREEVTCRTLQRLMC